MRSRKLEVWALVFSGVVFLLIGLALQVEALGPTPFQSPIDPPGPVPGPGETALLQALLAQLISGGLAGVLVWKFLDTLAGKAVVDVIADGLGYLLLGLSWDEVARYTAIVLSGVISVVAYLVAMAFGFVPDPGSTASWINLVLALLGVSFTGSQVIHIRVRSARQ